MTIIRVKKNKKNPYVMVNKEFVENSDLSWKAKGLLLYLLSKPDDWQVYLSQLECASKDGRHATTKAMKELEEKGYMIRFEKDKIEGKFQGFVYNVYEIPDLTPNRTDVDLPQRINRNGKTAVGKPDTTNKGYNNQESTNQSFPIGKEQCSFYNKMVKGKNRGLPLTYCRCVCQMNLCRPNELDCYKYFNLIKKEIDDFKGQDNFYGIAVNKIKDNIKNERGVWSEFYADVKRIDSTINPKIGEIL